MQEMNEMSGSRGEANFVWRCKNCKRESSANIKEAPKSYQQTEPPKPQKILEFDCRGLEFTEFKPEVRSTPWLPKNCGFHSHLDIVTCLSFF